MQQRGEGEVLGHAPIERKLALRHQPPVLDDPLHRGMELEVAGNGRDALAEHPQRLDRQPRIVTFVPFDSLVAAPVDLERGFVVGQDRLVGVITAVERLAAGGDHFIAAAGRDHALLCQAVRVELARGRQLRNRLVHQRLGHHRLILLVVPEAPVAHEVHHHVLVERHSVIERDLGHEAHRFGIVAVDVEDRHLQHFRDIGAIERRTCVAQVRARESDLVIDDDVHRAPRAIPPRLGHLEGFHVHALPRERGIAMDQHRQHLVPRVVAAAMLARAHRALDHRVDDFEVGRIERERNVHRPARGHDVGRKPLVVLDVAGKQIVVVLAFEFGEEILGHLTHGVDQHVDAAAVGHADHQFLHPRSSRILEQVVELGYERFAALEREPLLADVTRMQVFLQRLGRGQPLEDMPAVVGIIARRRADGFQPLLHPPFLRHVGDVHVLGANGAAVGVLQKLQDVAQLHLSRPDQRAGVEHRLQVGFGQPVEHGVELRDAGLLPPVERVYVGMARPLEAVRRNELQHAELLLSELRPVDHHRRAGRRPLLPQSRETILHVEMGNVGCAALDPLQLVEIIAPARLDRGRVLEPGLVERLDERRVRAVEVRVAEQLLHHHCTCLSTKSVTVCDA